MIKKRWLGEVTFEEERIPLLSGAVMKYIVHGVVRVQEGYLEREELDR